MSSKPLDLELLELIGRLPWQARQDLMAIATWMSAAIYCEGGPYDGHPVAYKPEVVEHTEQEERLIHVYRRIGSDPTLAYQGSRPCCDDPECGCIFGKSPCLHAAGEVTRKVKGFAK